MAAKTFEYKDFSGGDYGRLEAWRAPKNTFSGTNMLLYRTGEIGVRAGVRLTNPTGRANGVLWGMGRDPSTPGGIWYGQGTAMRTFNPNSTPGAIATASGALTGTPSGVVSVDGNGRTVYIATRNANGYSFDGAAVTSLSAMPNSQGIAAYGDRLVAVPITGGNILRYSDAASYNSWPAGNTITVGDTDQIGAIFAQRGHLAILKGNTSFFVLTGVPGVTDTLRPVCRYDGPGDQYQAGLTRSDDRIWLAPLNAQYVSAFDGTAVQSFDNYPLPLYSGIATRTILPLRDDDPAGLAISVPANSGAGTANEIWLRYRGAWTRHTLGVAISNLAAVCFHGYPQDGSATASRLRYGTKLVFTDGGGASAQPNFWTWQPFMDRPGLEADPFSASAERAGDDSSTPVSGTLTLPEQRTEDGSEVMVTGVIVDFRSWNTGSATNNHFDLAVNTLNSYEAAGVISSGTGSFDEAAASSSLAGTVRSKYFSFGDQGRGSGFQLALTNVKGVAFQRFRVITETYPPRFS